MDPPYNNSGEEISPTPPIMDWNPKITKTRPLNHEDNQVPHPTISHLETNYINSVVASFTGKFFHFGHGYFSSSSSVFKSN